MTVACPTLNETTPARSSPAHDVIDALSAAGRSVAVLAVHHVRAEGQVLTGGAEKYVCMVASLLLRRGARVHVGYSGDDIYQDLAAHEDRRRLTVERLDWIDPDLRGDRRIGPLTLALRMRWLRETGADTLFVVQQGSGTTYRASLLAARLLGLRTVSSIRQPAAPLEESATRRLFGVIPRPGLWRRRQIRRARFPADCCDAVIFNSRRVADEYAAQYGFDAARSRVIYNGEVVGAASAGVRGFGRRIGTAGRVTSAKGGDILLDAFSKIAADHPDASLHYFGDGPLVGELRSRADARGLGGRVVFHGYQRDREAVYRDIDFYVQPSLRESMANTVIEAQVRGLPCVVTDVGGMAECVADGQTGWLIPPGDAGGLADALRRAFDACDSYGAMSAAAGQRARGLFEMGRFERETLGAILGE
jgi:glycosyltransferase involved in cell wall biosynthesis